MLSASSCPHCNTRVPTAARRCPVCGAPVSARPVNDWTSVAESKVIPMRREAPVPPRGGSEPPPAA
jgi:hypothetical protein